MEDQVGASQEYQTPGQQPMEGNYYIDPQGQRFNNPAEFDQAMAQAMAAPLQPQQKPDFAAMRQEAMQRAVQQVTGRPMAEQVPPQPQPQVVYVRRNLTIAELALVFAISTVGVIAVQAGWNFATDVLPRIEIRDK